MRREPHIELRRDKLKALVHYVCHRAPNPKKLGATKLNKILFFSDIEAYLVLGHPISGERYVKHQYGPVSRHLNEILEELKQEEALAIADATGYSEYINHPYTQRLFFSLRRPRLDLFSPEEVSIIDETIQVICDQHTARSISDLSHNIVWENAEIGEELPYYTAFAHTLGEITSDDVDWALQELEKRGRGRVSEAKA